METKNGKKVLIQPSYFLARRLYLSYLVIFGTSDVFIYQMAQITASTLFAGILPYLIGSLRNFRERRQNIINEMLTLFSCCVFTTFNVVSVENNFELGYFVICILGGYIFIVIVGVMWSTIVGIRNSTRFYCVKRAYSKSRAKNQTLLKLNHEKRQKGSENISGVSSGRHRKKRLFSTPSSHLRLRQTKARTRTQAQTMETMGLLMPFKRSMRESKKCPWETLER